VTLERDGGQWILTVPAIPGCHTYGPSLSTSLVRLRDALRLFRPGDASLEITLEPIGELGERLREVDAARAALAVAEDRRRLAMSAALAQVVALGISRRDAATLLGISHQRVQQLIAIPSMPSWASDTASRS
jgi:hypothetical protein